MKIYDKDELVAYLSDTMHTTHAGIFEYIFSNMLADKYVVLISECVVHDFMYMSSSIRLFMDKGEIQFYAYVNQIEYLPVCKHVTLKRYGKKAAAEDKCLYIYSEDSYKIIVTFNYMHRNEFEKIMNEFKVSNMTADEFIFKKRGILKSKKYGF